MDELTTRYVVDELKAVAQRVEFRCETGAWDDNTYEEPESIANRIIALVRADERKRIRQALLSDEAVQAAYDALFSPHIADADLSHMPEVLDAALAAIGLTETQGENS